MEIMSPEFNYMVSAIIWAIIIFGFLIMFLVAGREKPKHYRREKDEGEVRQNG